MNTVDAAWRMIRGDFLPLQERVLAVIPWSGEIALIITELAVYRVDADPTCDFVVQRIGTR